MRSTVNSGPIFRDHLYPGGIVMSTEGHAQAMDTLRRNARLIQYRSEHKETEVPIIVRDESGLILRRVGRVKKTRELSEIVSLGTALRSDL